MSKKMLYRIHGDPEPGVMAVELGGYNVEAKTFQRGEKPEGWVSPDRLLQFLREEISEEPPAPAAEPAIEDEQTDSPAACPLEELKAAVAGAEEHDKEAKLKVDQFGAERGIKLDRRKSLSVMIETLEKSLADG